MIAFLDPRASPAVLVGEGHAPVVAVLLASTKILERPRFPDRRKWSRAAGRRGGCGGTRKAARCR
jgi:hypothetical protein